MYQDDHPTSTFSTSYSISRFSIFNKLFDLTTASIINANLGFISPLTVDKIAWFDPFTNISQHYHDKFRFTRKTNQLLRTQMDSTNLLMVTIVWMEIIDSITIKTSSSYKSIQTEINRPILFSSQSPIILAKITKKITKSKW